MRRFAAMLLIILLSACFACAEVSPRVSPVSDAPTVVPSASPTMSAPLSPEPSEPESWTGIYSAELPENSVAQIHVYNETEDSFGFSVMWFEFVVSEDDHVAADHEGFAATAVKNGDGTASFEVNLYDENGEPDYSNLSIDYIEHAIGKLVYSGDTVHLVYSALSYDDRYQPRTRDEVTVYNRRHDEATALSELPYSSFEYGLDDHVRGMTIEQAREIFGEPVGEEVYPEYTHMDDPETDAFVLAIEYECAAVRFYYTYGLDDYCWPYMIELRQDYLPFYRGITIGDSFDDVLACFPGGQWDQNAWNGGYVKLYGDFWIHKAIETDVPSGNKIIAVSDGGYRLLFIFDELDFLHMVYLGPTA